MTTIEIQLRSPAYAVQGLDKRFGATHAVDGVSLDFTAGRVHCLLGENGAGKSTIGKMLGGLYAPDKGTILVGDTPIAPGDMTAARASGIALVFQELSLAPDLSVRDNICLGVKPRRHPISWRRRRDEDELCRGVLNDLGLDLPLDAIVGVLPQAHQQLVEVAKALVSKPKLLILDEPTATLGGYDRDRLFGTIRRLRATGVAFVLVTHHVEEVLAIGDDISILKDGRLVAGFPVTPDLTVAELSMRLTGRKISTSAEALAAEPVGEPLLTIDGLTGRSGAPRTIEVSKGRVVALYGVVGCGREEIAWAVAGLVKPPPTVRLRLRGRAYAPSTPSRAARHGVTYLPSGRAANCVLPTLSIRENLMVRQLRGRFGFVQSAAKERERASFEFKRYGTRLRHPDDPISSLSGGNQQKVMLGRSLGAGGDLLVLEDPTAGIDVGAKADIHAILKREVEKGLGVLLVSSDLEETVALADVVYTMFAGQLVSRYRAPLADHHAAIVTDIVGGAVGDPVGGTQEAAHVHA